LQFGSSVKKSNKNPIRKGSYVPQGAEIFTDNGKEWPKRRQKQKRLESFAERFVV
jgi:hypothetical protein